MRGKEGNTETWRRQGTELFYRCCKSEEGNPNRIVILRNEGSGLEQIPPPSGCRSKKIKMKVTSYTQDPQVAELIKQLHDSNIPSKIFSDVTDGTRQYVDLVMEGGGVLGVALAGYVYVLEQMNIRFLQLGGTSAGAINTMLMATAGPIEQTKTEWILEKIVNKDFYDFVDGDNSAKNFIDALLNDASNVKLAWRALQVVPDFRDDLGLCAGQQFYEWMRNLMREKNIYTLQDLLELRRITPGGGLYNRYAESIKYTPANYERIVIVVADVSTQSKIIFPEMAHLYWAFPLEVCPAQFVRASMSIPFFYHPYRVKDIPQGYDAEIAWFKSTGFKGVPKEVVMVDGGIMSNFPIDVFHVQGAVPHAPTFGVKLGYERIKTQRTDKFFPYLSSVFDAARHIHDYDFIARNPDYNKLLCCIDTGDHNWMNFRITDEAKLDLFRRGVKAGANFLKGFEKLAPAFTPRRNRSSLASSVIRKFIQL